MASRAQANVTTDHDEIRQWAEERGARPTCVRGTGGGADIGMLRLDFPGYSGEGKLQEIGWDDWFDKFDQRGLALLYQNTTARGQKSNFNKLVARETAEARAGGARKASRRSLRAVGNRSTKTARGRATAASSKRRATTIRGKATSRHKTVARRATRKRTTRAAAAKKVSRGVSSRARTRRKAA